MRLSNLILSEMLTWSVEVHYRGALGTRLDLLSELPYTI